VIEPVRLNDAQLQALWITLDVFVARGEWPNYDYVERELHRRELPGVEVLASLPLELAHFDRYRPTQTPIELTIEALARIGGASEDLDLFLRTVRWLARCERDYEPPSPTDTANINVTSTEFVQHERLTLDRMQLAKILALLRVEWLTIGSAGPAREEPIWQVTLDRRIRPYVGVAGVDEYLAIKRQVAAEAARQPPPTLPVELEAGDETGEGATEGPADPHKVFVVHGRNAAARVAMFELLRAFGLHPLEWRELRAATGKPSPYIGEILDAGFAISQACLVLMTPDEEVRLRDEFVEEEIERIVSHQPRPNVLLEAGMALAKFRDRTVIVELGRMRPVSDLAGIHTLRMNNTREKREELAERLRDARCDVRAEGTAWQTAGDFDAAIGPGPPPTPLAAVDTTAEREPVSADVARRLEADLEDANDMIGAAIGEQRLWGADRHLPLSRWQDHQEAFSRLGRTIDKPVRDAFRKLGQLDQEARRRPANDEVAVGTTVGDPTLALDDAEISRLRDLQGVLVHAMEALQGIQT
jgi:predicted nucleotide-binding protein